MNRLTQILLLPAVLVIEAWIVVMFLALCAHAVFQWLVKP